MASSPLSRTEAPPIRLMIVGAPKCATTALRRYLGEHPQLHTHAQREFVYFVQDEMYRQGYELAFRRFFGAGPPPGSALVAKHVLLMYSPEAVVRLANHRPELHAVSMLRNPVDRARSAYWYARMRGWEDAPTFEEGLAREDRRRAHDGFRHPSMAYVEHGIYAPHVARMLEHFGEDRFDVLLTEDLRREPLPLLRHTFAMCGVDPNFEPDLRRRHNEGGVARSERFARAFSRLTLSRGPLRRALRALLPGGLAPALRERIIEANSMPGATPPMSAETRARLVQRFRPHNEALSRLIGRDLESWNAGAH